jgi:hypothetical protein
MEVKMKHLLLVILFAVSSLSLANEFNNITEDNVAIKNTVNPPASESKWYYGGNIGFSFWSDYTYLGIYPLVGYKIKPQFSVGGKIGYSYINYKDANPSYDTHNYGGSIFTRYRIIPQIYLHGEFVYFSFEHQTYDLVNREFGTERIWVPFLLLGGGFSQNISPNVWAFAEVLFDVINNSNSPYKSGEPLVSFGVGVGF